jgi:hypothetical protein
MASAWNVSGPLLEGCLVRVLDCSLADPGVVFPNPAQPFAFPAVRCNASISTAPMRVFSGSKCRLIQAGNDQDCSWDNAKQARACMHAGAGSVEVSSLTRTPRRAGVCWRRLRRERRRRSVRVPSRACFAAAAMRRHRPV